MMRDDRERITREAIAIERSRRSTVTRAYTGPEALPVPDHSALISVYRDRVTAKPNPRFRIPSSMLSGEALSNPLSFTCLLLPD